VAPDLNVGNLVGYFTLDTSDLTRAQQSVTGALGDIRTGGSRQASAAGAAVGAALTGGVIQAARGIAQAGQRVGEQFTDAVADGTRGAISAVDKLRAQAVIAGDKAAAAMSRYQQAMADAAAGSTEAQRSLRRLGAEATISGADAQRAMDQFGDAAKKAADDATKVAADTKESFAGIGDAAKGAIAGLGLGTVLAKAMNADDASRKLTAQLHLSADEAGRFGKDAGALYSGNFADSLETANDAIRAVVANIGGMRTASSSDLQSITGQVSSLAQTFDVELGGTAVAVGQLLKTGLAKNAQEALDIVTAGFQAGDDKAGDFLDTLNEYSVQWQKLGIDGKTAVGLVSQALQGGARDSDVAGDALKEFAIRVSTVSTTTTQGFEALGLSASDMYAQFGKGGPSAAAALQLVLDKVKATEDPVVRATVATDLFGSQWEDLGGSLLSFDPRTAADGLGKIAGRAQELTDTVGGSASGAISSFWKSLQTTATTIGGELLPQLTPLLPALQDIAGAATTLVGGFLSLPDPLKNAGLALGGILLLKGPLIGMFGQIQARAAAMAVSLAASNGVAGAAGVAAGGLSRFAGVMGGPWGLAIGVGVTALASWIGKSKDAVIVTGDYTSAIDANTGALTGNAPAVAAKALADDGALARMEHAGVAQGDLTRAVLGDTAARERAKDAIAAHALSILQANGATEDGASSFNLYKKSAEESGLSLQDYTKQVLASGDARKEFASAGVSFKDIDDPRDIQSATLAWSVLTDETGKFGKQQAEVKAAIGETTAAQRADEQAAKDRAAALAVGAGATQTGNAAEAQRETILRTSTGALQSANAAEHSYAQAAIDTAQAVGSANSAEHDQAATYSESQTRVNDLAVAQGLLAQAVKQVHDAPTKDFAAMEASIKGVTDETSKASTETSAFAIEIDKLTGRNVPLADATKALNDQVRALAGTFGDAKETAAAHADALVNDRGVIDTVTDAGSKLYDSVTSYSDAYNTSVTAAMDAAGAHATVTQRVNAARTAADSAWHSFINQAEGMGISHDKAVALAAQMGILEGKRLTPKTLHLDAQDKASTTVDALDKKVQGLKDKEVQLKVHAVGLTADANGAMTTRVNSDGSFQVANGLQGNAEGGYITGPGTGKSDSIISRLSNGEFVNNALSTARNRKALEYANAGGIIPGFANGGYVNYQMSATDNTGSAFDKTAGILSTAQSSADKNNAAVDKAAKAAAAAAAAIPAASSGVAQWVPLMTKVITAKLGAAAVARVLPVMEAQMEHESSGNPAAINLTDSNAIAGHPSVGLLQFIPTTFARYADPGFNSNIYDPESQMRAFINYVPAQYGSFDYLTSIGNGAYAKGGEVQTAGTGTSDSGLARVSNGEFINTALATARNRKALEFANKGGTIPGFAAGGYVGNVSGHQLAGAPDPVFGDRLGRAIDALAGLTAEVGNTRAILADASSHEKDTFANLVAAQRDVATASKGDKKAAEAKSAAARREYLAAIEQRKAATMNVKAAEGTMKVLTSNVRGQKSAADRFDRVANALGVAGDRLSDLKGQRAQLAGSVAGTLAGTGGGITGNSETRRTGAQVDAGLTYTLKQVIQFKRDLAAAKARGIDSGLLADVAGKGVDGGGVTAHALATASRAEIGSINRTQREILAQSAAAGNLVAGAQFDPLIRSQQRVVDSLAHTLSGLDRYLERNGAAMAGAVERAMSRFKVEINAQGAARIVNEGNRQLGRRG
jgi:hypothetical protein